MIDELRVELWSNISTLMISSKSMKKILEKEWTKKEDRKTKEHYYYLSTGFNKLHRINDGKWMELRYTVPGIYTRHTQHTYLKSTRSTY